MKIVIALVLVMIFFTLPVRAEDAPVRDSGIVPKLLHKLVNNQGVW